MKNKREKKENRKKPMRNKNRIKFHSKQNLHQSEGKNIRQAKINAFRNLI